MKIYEYQARILFDEYKIPIQQGRVAETPREAHDVSRELGCPVVVKAQVLIGGRGKAGGVKIAESPEEAFIAARDILSMRINEIPVNRVLVNRAVNIQKEYYLGITVDSAEKKVVCIVSTSGGIEIEEVAAKEAEKIMKLYVNPFEGLDAEELENFLSKTFQVQLVPQVCETMLNMYRLLQEKDCSLVEINPYAQIDDGKLIAIDAKINFDDSGLFKHPEIESLKNPEEYSEDEINAQKAGLSFVGLDGDIGCIVNGAGLAMATMDMIKLMGGKPANFLDIGGSSNPGKVLNALKILLKNKKIKAILINIFGGITRCDDVANGILMTMEKISIPVPLIIRLIGTNQREGREILKGKGYDCFDNLTDAVRESIDKAYALDRGETN